MLSHDCIECAKTNKLIEEKEKKLTVYQNNLFELKSKMSETSSLINVYFNYKNENENLKKEMEVLRKRADVGSVSSVNNSKMNYEIELIRNKFLKECDRVKNLEVANTQLSGMVEELRSNQDFNLKNEIMKLKKEVSDKERQINSLNLLLDKLKNELVEEKNKKLEKFESESKSEIIKKNNDDDFITVDNFDTHLINPDFNLFSTKIKLDDNKNKNLVKENEYLKTKFQKYQIKYTKFKYKYKTLKSITKFFNFGNLQNTFNLKNFNEDKFLNQKKSRSDSYLHREDEHINNIAKIHKSNLSRKNSLNKSFELFENNNNYIFEHAHEFEHEKENLNKVHKTKKIISDEEEINNIDESSESEIEIKSKKKKLNKKSESKFKTKNKKEKEKKIKIEKIENKKSKLKKKLKSPSENSSESEKSENEKSDNSIEKEEDEDVRIEVEDDIPPQINTRTNHIGPIRKEKIDESSLLLKHKEELINEFINFNNSLNTLSEEEIITNFIFNFCKGNTLHEKVTIIFEIISENSDKLEILNLIYLLKFFIVVNMNTNIIHIFKEYILSHLDFIFTKENISFIYNKQNDEIKIKNVFNSITDDKSELLKNHLNTNYIISYILSLLYLYSEKHSEIFELILEIMERLNNKDKSILILFRQITKDSNLDLILNSVREIEEYRSNKNINKIYFFNFYKNLIITETFANVILTIIDIWVEEKININNDQGINKIIQILKSKLNEIENYIKITDFENDKINLTIDLKYLEIYQILTILFDTGIKDLDWIYSNVFENILWLEFLKTEEESLKRIGVIYFISLMLTNFINEDPKCEKESTQKLVNWICAIFDPKFDGQKITPFDRIAALSGLVDTHLIKVDVNALEMVKGSLKSILQSTNKESFPDDFSDKIKKLNLL